MAGDWIKIEKATARKPEVLAIAELLQIHPDHAFGLCVRFWSWCDDHLSSGNARSVTKNALDALLERSGFADALIKVDWLQVRSGSLEVPNFDRHLSQSAKKRGLTAHRVAECKAKKGNAPNVTGALPEKRREDTKTESEGARVVTLETALEFASKKQGYDSETVKAWFSARDSQGWCKGNSLPITNWQSDLDAWVLREARGNAPGGQMQRRPQSEARRDAERTGITSTQTVRRL